MCAEAISGGERPFCHRCGAAQLTLEADPLAGSGPSDRVCRTCSRTYRADFRFCPMDGSALAPVDAVPPAPAHGADAALAAVAVVRGSASASDYRFGPGAYVVGRDVNDCAVIARRDPYMNPRHATLTVSESGVLLTDEGSENGTFVRCEGATQLWHGAQVLVGTTVLRAAMTAGLRPVKPEGADPS